MHPAAMQWIGEHASDAKVRVLDVGGRNINGSPAELFPNATQYVVVDLIEHESVDIVGDILELSVKDLDGPFDFIIYAEVAEHTEQWREHLDHLFDLLEPGGTLIVTAANPDRTPHSAVDGGPIRDDEFYANINPEELGDVLYGLSHISAVNVAGADVRAVAVKDKPVPKSPAKKKAPAKKASDG